MSSKFTPSAKTTQLSRTICNSYGTTSVLILSIFAFSLSASLSGCMGRRVNQEDAEAPVDAEAQTNSTASPKEALTDDMSSEQKIQTLNAALSRAQSRIEELDAKVSSLTDKLESTKLTVDNIAGTQASVPTQIIGESTPSTTPVAIESKPAPEQEAQPSHESEIISEFRAAQEQYKTGKYSDAVLAFNLFAGAHPDHILAGSAQFQAGESYLQLGEAKLALAEFGKVVSTFHSSPRVPTALVRIAHCYKILGNEVESNRTLALVNDLYPGNPSLDLIPPSPQSALHKTVDNELQTAPMEH